jgi:hypothetical protein
MSSGSTTTTGPGRPFIAVAKARWDATCSALPLESIAKSIVASARSIEPGSFNWIGQDLYIDLKGEYNLSTRFGVFLSIRNLGNAYEDVERRGPNTPDYAKIYSRYDYAQLWTVGVKGSF